MKKIISTISLGCFLLLSACNSAPSSNNKTVDTAAQKQTDTIAVAIPKNYEITYLDNKKDPTCGMPVTAGVTDTAHYGNKVIGFCSIECKNEFLKNPKAGIAAAELKKQ
jgi:YHS domain-containing protein